LVRRRIAADIRNMRSRVDELLPLAEKNEGFVTAVQARSLGVKGSRPGASHSAGNLGLVNSRFARLKCNRARIAFQQEHKANKTYRQLAFPAMTFSNLQRREAPLSTRTHC
jgi:hypothetical protein